MTWIVHLNTVLKRVQLSLWTHFICCGARPRSQDLKGTRPGQTELSPGSQRTQAGSGPISEQAPQRLSQWQGCTASTQALAMGSQTAVGWWGWCGPPDNFDNGDSKMAGALNRTRAEYYLYYVEEARNMGKKNLFFFFSFYSCRKEKKKKKKNLTWKHFFT